MTARTLALAAAAAAALAGAPPKAAALPSSARVERLEIPGLAAPARIKIDLWGVPHIYAGSERDAFFLQGWNAARDRLWQIDLWRKRGLGRLSESLGPDYAAQDRAARLLLYRGDMDAEWSAYGPGAKARAEAFAAGINAYVDAALAGSRPLPVEFGLTGSRPEHWRAEDIVRIRSHGLTRNLASEVARAQVACAAGLEADRLRQPLTPAITPRLPEGLDPCVVTPDVLRDYRLGTEDVRFAEPGQRLASEESADILTALADDAAAEGSNNWVIAPSKSATGRPILANDPHRSLGVPSLRYIVQLKAPGLDVIGAGEPALPGISIGHNETIAFGLTIFGVDQEDLVVYALNPANLRQYRYKGGWVDMTAARETIAVKGEAPRETDLLFTRDGPVLKLDPAHGVAFALRSVWRQPGTSAYFGSSAYMTATSWDQFTAAMANWGAPSENLVYADVSGHIGWVPEGLAPIRSGYDGLTPVPGDGRYEWTGFHKASDFPRLFDPKSGWFASANEMNLPAEGPFRSAGFGYEWADRSRIDRISEVLGAPGRLTLADAMALQSDDHSRLALRFVGTLAGLEAGTPREADALARLRAWDGEETRDSVAASIFETWTVKHLGRALALAALPAGARGPAEGGPPDAGVRALEAGEGVLAPGSETRKAALLASLGAALDELTARLGPDMDGWAWGRLHHLDWSPSVASLADPALKAQMRVGVLEAAGSSSTPMAQTWRADDFSVIAGASFRMVLDVGDWDASRAINTPGQSGDPFSPRYRDLLPLWNTGRYFPLLYSDAAVDAATDAELELTPAR